MLYNRKRKLLSKQNNHGNKNMSCEIINFEFSGELNLGDFPEWFSPESNRSFQ